MGFVSYNRQPPSPCHGNTPHNALIQLCYIHTLSMHACAEPTWRLIELLTIIYNGSIRLSLCQIQVDFEPKFIHYAISACFFAPRCQPHRGGPRD